MGIDKILDDFKDTRAAKETELLEKAHELLKNSLDDWPYFERKSLYQSALARAEFAAEENANVEFVCATLFFDLVHKKSNLGEIVQKSLNKNIELLINGYNYLRNEGKEISEDLFKHSYRTAMQLAGIKIDAAAICAGLLHEIPIHTNIPLEQVEKKFGEEIILLISNFKAIKQIKTSNNKQYASHLREMVVAMAKDMRVVIIKMCSNLDRMKNPDDKSPEHLKNIALESREILAPLADLLGIWQLRWQIEDYSFKILEPDEYEKISRRFNVDEKKNRDKYIQKTKNILQKTAKEDGIDCQIDGRFKHFYSIYLKMKSKKKSFDEICDVFALRVVVGTIDECYRLLGTIHRLWRPKQRRFKDYIAAPKSNKYRSLHTTVFGLNGRSTEFQIRTKEMDEEANFGISAHWYYKNPRKKVPLWIQNLLIKQQQYKDDQEFVSKFTTDLLDTRVYVYSPKGDVISLPVGSTPIDFAYHIHTEIGNKCAEAIVNDLHVPLSYQLNTNDIVQIVTDRNQSGPRAEWLKFVKTHAAQKHIEEYLHRQPMERSFRL